MTGVVVQKTVVDIEEKTQTSGVFNFADGMNRQVNQVFVKRFEPALFCNNVKKSIYIADAAMPDAAQKQLVAVKLAGVGAENRLQVVVQQVCGRFLMVVNMVVRIRTGGLPSMKPV
jgi:phenylacetate-coenzyme A ligase PaaK-like adenylate-forming protein